MATILNDVEVRVLGSLIEKQVTTPEYYPLTLNSLTLPVIRRTTAILSLHSMKQPSRKRLRVCVKKILFTSFMAAPAACPSTSM